MLKQATTVAAASLIAAFMSGCASLPDVYKTAPKDNVCKPGDTYEQCCEKRELKKPLKYRFGGACVRDGGGNDRSEQSAPDRGGDKPGNDNSGGGQPDSEGPSNEGRGNTGHDHGNGGGQTGGGQTGGGQTGGGETDGGGKSDNDKGGDRDGGPGQGPGGRGDVGGRDHSALKIVRPAFA